MRYTGTRTSADVGRIKLRNLLQFKIDREASINQQLEAIKTSLQRHGASIILKPLPVTKFETVLVYTPTGEADTAAILLTNGYTEASLDSSLNKSAWNERIFTIRLSDVDAQLIEAALKNKQAAISLSYAFYTSFSAKGASSIAVTTNGRVNKKALAYFNSANVTNKDSLFKKCNCKGRCYPH